MERLVTILLVICLPVAGVAEESLEMLQAKVIELQKEADAMASIVLDLRARIDLLEREAEEAAVDNDDWPEPDLDMKINVEEERYKLPDAAFTNWYSQWTGTTGATLVAYHSAASIEYNTNGHYGIFDFQSPTFQVYNLASDTPDLSYTNGGYLTMFWYSQTAGQADKPEVRYIDISGGLQDEWVGITTNDSTPGYLGGHGESGELRLLSTGGGSTNYGGLSAAGLFYKAFGAGADEYVALAHDDLTALSGSQGGGAGQVLTALSLDTASGNIGLTSVDGLGHVDALTWSNIGDVLTNSAYMPAGTNNYDLLRWQTSDDTWTLLLNDSSVLQYQVLQKKGSGAGGEVGYDWVRAH